MRERLRGAFGCENPWGGGICPELPAADGQRAIGCYAEWHAVGKGYFPVKGTFPTACKDGITLIEQGQNCPHYESHSERSAQHRDVTNGAQCALEQYCRSVVPRAGTSSSLWIEGETPSSTERLAATIASGGEVCGFGMGVYGERLYHVSRVLRVWKMNSGIIKSCAFSNRVGAVNPVYASGIRQKWPGQT